MQDSANESMAIGVPGQLADISNSVIDTYINNTPQLDLITVTAANLATTLTITDTAFAVNVGAAVLTVAAIGALLVAAVNAGAEPVTATDLEDGTFWVQADAPGTAFTSTGTTNCTVTNTVINETSIPFGVVVVQDTWTGKDNLAHLPSLTAEITTVNVPLGITVHSQAFEQALLNADNEGYPHQSAMSICRRGRVYVEVEDAVTVGGQVFVRFSAGATEQLGAMRSDADTADAVALPYARFKTSAAAGGIAIVELNLP